MPNTNMMHQTITKIPKIVILNLLLAAFSISCGNDSPKKTENPKEIDFSAPKIIGKISTSEIKESSGLVVSQCNKNILWTHNDSGSDPKIYALDLKGNLLGIWNVSNAENVDWEDIATRKIDNNCYLYIADTGNNFRIRDNLTVYKVLEPSVQANSKYLETKTKKAKSIKFSYPDSNNDAEALLVNSQSGDIFVAAKSMSGAAGLYKLQENEASGIAKKVAEIELPALPNGMITGGDFSKDGKHIVFCDYYAAYEYTVSNDSDSLSQIFKKEPYIIELGTRKQGEAIAYSPDGNSIYASSEKKNSPLIRVDRR